MNDFKRIAGIVILAATSLFLPRIVLASGSVTILAPKDHAALNGGDGIELKYNVDLGANGNHLHVYVDNRRPIIDRNVSGCPCTLRLPSLGPGTHTVAVKVATVHHHLTGAQSSVTFSVQSPMSSSGGGGGYGGDSGY